MNYLQKLLIFQIIELDFRVKMDKITLMMIFWCEYLKKIVSRFARVNYLTYP